MLSPGLSRKSICYRNVSYEKYWEDIANLPIGGIESDSLDANQDFFVAQLREGLLLDSNLSLFDDDKSEMFRW